MKKPAKVVSFQAEVYIDIGVRERKRVGGGVGGVIFFVAALPWVQPIMCLMESSLCVKRGMLKWVAVFIVE